MTVSTNQSGTAGAKSTKRSPVRDTAPPVTTRSLLLQAAAERFAPPKEG